MPLRFAWEKPAPSTLCYADLHFSACAVCFTPLHCIPLDPFPVRHARAALRYCKIFIEIRPHPPLPDHRTVGFWLMHVSGGRAAALLAGDSHRKWNSKCFSEYLN